MTLVSTYSDNLIMFRQPDQN